MSEEFKTPELNECCVNPLRPYINGNPWEVRIVPHHKMPNYEIGKLALGHCDYGQLIISLNEELSVCSFNITATHELTHAFLFSCGFDQVDHSIETLCDFVAIYGKRIIEMSRIITDYRWSKHETMLERITSLKG